MDNVSLMSWKSGLRFFGHPLHPILSAFPIPLLGTSLFWDGIGYFRGGSFWWSISFWNICLGLLFSVLTAASGLMDYVCISKVNPVIETATTHMLYMMSAITVYAISAVVRAGPGIPMGPKLWAVLGLEALGLGLMMTGGWFGGELVFRFGLGRNDNNQSFD
jgi:uncharacterized membrane protein